MTTIGTAEHTELREKVKAILATDGLASFATLKDAKPWVRYVMLHADDDLSLYFTTSRKSRKVGQIEANPSCHITAGGSATDFTRPYIQVEGRAEVLDDLATKKRFWVDYLANMFSGVEDPNYVVVRVKPSIIEVMGAGSMEPVVHKLG